MAEDDDEELCPICAEPLDETERRFKPCRCGYQMCGFCWHHIKDELNGPCPQCRTPYSPENYSYLPPAPAAKKGAKKHGGRATAATAAATAAPAVGAAELEARKRLADIRVVQRNLVYVTNIPLGFLGCGPNTPLAAAAADGAVQVLRHAEYFGQYGRIVKLVVNTGTVYNANSPQGPTVSCYVTYRRNEEAAACVRAVNGAWLDGKLLRASFGTTKYCAHFLRGSVCTNPDCLYLHELGHDRDSFTKEAMAVGKNLFSSHVQPRIAFALADGKNVLPPAAAVPAKPSPFIPPPIAYERALQLLPPESPADAVRQQPLQPKPGAKAVERREDDGAFSLLVAGVLTHFLSHISRPLSSRACASATSAVSQPSPPPVVAPAAVSAAAAARERLSRSEDVDIVGTTRGRSVSPVGSSMQSSSPPAAGSYLAAVRAFHPSQTTSPSASPPLPQGEVSPDSSPKSSQSSSADTPPAAAATTTTDQQQSRKKKKKQEVADPTPEATESSTRVKADPPGSYPMPQQQQQQQQQAPLPLPAMPLLPPVLWFAESFKMMQHQPQDPTPEPPSLPAEPAMPAEAPEDVAEIAPLDFVESLLNESQSSQPSSPPAQTVPAVPVPAPALDPVELRRQCFRELFPSVHISFSDEPDQVQPQQAFPAWQPLHRSSGPQPYNPFLPAAFQVASFAPTAPPPQPDIPAFAAPPPQPALPPKHRAHTHHAPAPEPGQPPEKLAQASTPAVSASISAPTASQSASPATAKPGPASPPAILTQTAAPASAPKQTQASAQTSKAPIVAPAASPPPGLVEQPRPVRQKPKLKIQTKEHQQQQQQRLEPLIEPPPVSPMTPLPPPVLPVPQLQQKPSPEHTSPQLPTPARRAKKPAEEESHMKATATSQESTAPQERKLSKRQLRMQRRQQAQAASTSEAASTSPAISAVAKEESPRAAEPQEARSAVQPQQQATSSKKQKSRAKSPQQPQATSAAAAATTTTGTAAAAAEAEAETAAPASDPRESGETEDLIVGACPGCGGLILRDDLFASLSLSSATMDIAALEQIATDVSTIAEALPDSLHGISELMRVHKAAAACDHGEYTHIPIMLPILPVPLCPLRFSRVTADLLDDSHTITELLSAIDPLGGHQQQTARAPTTQEEVQRLEAEWASTCHDFEELDARLRELQLRTSTTSAPTTSKFDIPH